MMAPVRAEKFNSNHSTQLPDIGIWRSPLTTRMMLTGRIGVSKELVTEELPLLNIHTDKIAEYEAITKEKQMLDKNHISVNNADLEEIDTYLDQKEFYYCKQLKLFDNFYAKEPKDGIRN